MFVTSLCFHIIQNNFSTQHGKTLSVHGMDSSFNEEMKPRSRTFSRGLMNRKSKTVEEENSRLKEMLQQSLSREADALRKLKHLQLKYLQVLSKNSSVPDASPKFERKAQCKLEKDSNLTRR